MGGGSTNVLSAVVNPFNAITPIVNSVKNNLYDKPKQARKDAQKLAEQQQAELENQRKVFQAQNDKYAKDTSDAAQLAFAKLKAARSMKRSTILTSPLGIPGGDVQGRKLLGI